jgi:phosphomannomutase
MLNLNMNISYVFDVDGTLTPSRAKMDPKFKDWFVEWQKTHNTYLVTGSDYPKTLAQVGEEVIDNAKMIFNCCGNEVRIGKLITHASNWQPPHELIDALDEELTNSKFPIRTGNHIEIRTGLVNFSVLGRGADSQQRDTYKKYDEEHGERIDIALRLERQFKNIDFMIGGDTGIDIYPTGKDKRQVLEFIKPTGPVIFFGDKTLPGGNDYPLAVSVDIAHRVENWEHTWEILKLSSN